MLLTALVPETKAWCYHLLSGRIIRFAKTA